MRISIISLAVLASLSSAALCISPVTLTTYEIDEPPLRFKCTNETLLEDEQIAFFIAFEQLDQFPGFRQVRRGRHNDAVIYAKAHCLNDDIDLCTQCVRNLTVLTRLNCQLASGATAIAPHCKIRYQNFLFRAFDRWSYLFHSMWRNTLHFFLSNIFYTNNKHVTWDAVRFLHLLGLNLSVYFICCTCCTAAQGVMDEETLVAMSLNFYCRQLTQFSALLKIPLLWTNYDDSNVFSS